MAEAKREGCGNPGHLFVFIIISLHCLKTGPYILHLLLLQLHYITRYVIRVLVV